MYVYVHETLSEYLFSESVLLTEYGGKNGSILCFTI